MIDTTRSNLAKHWKELTAVPAWKLVVVAVVVGIAMYAVSALCGA